MNLGDIRTLTRTLLSESTPKYWSDAELTNYINYGETDFCVKTDCLEDISTMSSVQYQADYDLPDNYTKIKRVEIIKGSSIYEIRPEDLIEHYTGIVKTTSSPPEGYNIFEEKLRLRERPSSAAPYTTLSAAITTTTATTISLTSGSGFPSNGRVYIDDECIKFWNNSSDTLTGCERGAEGTTKATHLSGATVYLRDIWVYHYKKDVTLTSDSDTPSIPAQFHEALAWYAAGIGRHKSKDYDLADKFMAKYAEFITAGIDWSKGRWKRVYKPK